MHSMRSGVGTSSIRRVYSVLGWAAKGWRGATRVCLVAGGLLGVAACGSASGSDPIAWWRQLEGGRLAQERPAAPNADAPYPNLSSVPARPMTTTAAARGGIAAGLESDRRDGAFAAGQPILPPSARIAAPAPVPVGGIGASLAAASAPAAVEPAVVAPVAARPVPAPVAHMVAPAIAEAALTLPAGPPAAPRLPGVAAVTAPTLARRAPPPVAPAAAPFMPGAPVGVAFGAVSAVLPEGAAEALRRLAATRAGRDIWVVGYGESAASDAGSQAGTLRLGFVRALAMATVLGQAGVPASALRVAGEAVGRGGVARIAE